MAAIVSAARCRWRQGRPRSTRPVVTRSFELYVDGARWLLAIVAGLLAFAFDAVQSHPDHVPSLLIFAVLAVALCVSAASALFYLVYSYTYLTRREAGLPNSRPEVSGPFIRSVRAFWWMIGSFGVGLLLFVGFGAAQLLALRRADPPVIVHAAGTDRPIVQRGKRFWVLGRDSHRRPEWQPLPPAPP